MGRPRSSPDQGPRARPVFAWECNVAGKDWHSTVNHWTASKARYEYLLEVWEAWPDISFADVTVRKIGPAHTSAAFERTAAYRGLPTLRCGARVAVHTGNGRAMGTVVGSNDSANFDVLFDEDGCFKGARLNVHPGEMRIIEVQAERADAAH